MTAARVARALVVALTVLAGAALSALTGATAAAVREPSCRAHDPVKDSSSRRGRSSANAS